MPVAPASRSAISVIASSPSNGPSMASPPASISARSLAAACGVSILKSFTCSISRAMRARKGDGEGDAGDRRVLHHDRDAARLADPGEMLEGRLLVGAEQRAVVGRHHHHHGRAEVGRLARAGLGDGGREVRDRDDDRHPARRRARGRAGSATFRSSSESRNCSEKLARMQMPSTPWSTMQSMTRFMPSRSRAPVVGEGGGRDRPDAGVGSFGHGQPLTPEEIITASVTRRWKIR